MDRSMEESENGINNSVAKLELEAANSSGMHSSIMMNKSDMESMNPSNLTGYESSMLMSSTHQMPDDMTSQLASSGMAGVAAAAAIATSHRKSMLYNFESVPAVRKRHSTRLLRKIQQLVDEFTVRVGQQACLLVCSPKSAYKTANENPSMNNSVIFKIFGSSPLDNVIRNLRDVITQDLENALQNYQMINTNESYYQPLEVLPPLMIDGIPTPLDKMTQAQLRAFIPVMLKYSTGRTKPAWGRPTSRPPWWPDDVPWANVRSDVRTDEEKQRQSWTNALKKVVRSCYEYHGKSEYLHDFSNMVLQPNNSMDPQDIMVMEQHHHHHHHGNMDYVVHDHMHNQVSGRHLLLNEHEAVEAQLRALQNTYSISTGHDNSVPIMHMDTGNTLQPSSGGIPNSHQDPSQMDKNVLADYASNNSIQQHLDDQSVKEEDLVNLPPGSVVQLDSISTAELYHFFQNSQRNHNENGDQTNQQHLGVHQQPYTTDNPTSFKRSTRSPKDPNNDENRLDVNIENL